MKKLLYILPLLIFISCDKEGETAGNNPFKDWGSGDTTNNGKSDKPIDATTIVGLHRDVFLPTCANSGCHDGLFEPDFRTIESSYNSLVNRPVIKNTFDNDYTARVLPGNAEASMLIHRLTVDLNGNSGIMPLSLEETSDWLQKKEEYIDNIKTWINNGAKDQFGRVPSQVDFKPEMKGMIGFYSGGIEATRSGNNRPIEVPIGAGGVEVWIAYKDDNTAVNSFTTNAVKFGINPYGWDTAKTANMQISGSPKTAKGFDRVTDETYYHKVYIPFIGYQAEDVLWVRTFVSDNVNGVTEVPNDNSLLSAKKYFTIELKP